LNKNLHGFQLYLLIELFWAGYLGAVATRFYEIFDAGRKVKKHNHQLLTHYGINPGFSMNIVPQKRGASLMLALSF